MEKRTSAPARIFAAIALMGAALVVIVVIASSAGDSDSGTKSSPGSGKVRKSSPKTKAKSYVVKSGDTLVSIAHRTGVPVGHIVALNPDVDPQILIAGQTLRLR